MHSARVIPDYRYHTEIHALSKDNIVAIFGFIAAFFQVYGPVCGRAAFAGAG